MNDDCWPALPYAEWKDTYATLHMWSQIVGKVALALAPPLNHSWGIALHLTSRGLTTLPLTHGVRSFTIEFDFISHALVIRTVDGEERSLRLEPKSVADFYSEVMQLLDSMSLAVKIWPVPVEITDPVPFEKDTQHHSYDPEYANRFWRILVSVERVFTKARCPFVGKSSPAHFFWGSFDLAITRFSGRPAPSMEGPAFMREAYSHEVISHGFWPGSGALLEPSFYAYAVPAPTGFADMKVAPPAAYFHQTMGEYILPYEAVRTAENPEELIEAFVTSTYEGAAGLAKWDRPALERAMTPPNEA